MSLIHLIAIGREENTALFSQLLTLSFVASFSSSQSASMLLASPILSQMQTNLSKSTVSNALYTMHMKDIKFWRTYALGDPSTKISAHAENELVRSKLR